jgi:predicted membrane-bound spermidine synthase
MIRIIDKMFVEIKSFDSARPEQTITWKGQLVDSLRTSKTRIELINTPTFGNILFMDDALQSSEYDYELYHRVLVKPLARYIGIEGKPAIVFGGGEGCTSAELVAAGAKHVTQIDHDKEAIDWATTALARWNKDIYRNTDTLNVIIDDAFEVVRTGRGRVQAPLVVVDLFDPDKETLEEYALLLTHICEDWLVSTGNNGAAKCGLVAYFGLWPNAAISGKMIELTLRAAGLSRDFDVRGYVHYIPSFCAECLFLVIVPSSSASPHLEAGSRWVF